MSLVQIKSVRQHDGIVVACGRAETSIIGVFGQCSPAQGHDPSFSGMTTAYHLSECQGRYFYKWLILFPAPSDSGLCRVRVVGLNSGGVEAADELTIGLDGAHGKAAPKNPGIAKGNITITSHSPNQNITAEKDDFTPYGGLIQTPLGNVWMQRTANPADNHMVFPDNKYSEHVYQQFWSAQFPTIPRGTWTLHAC